MGLSGRKVKQRIPNDPRNLSWADDAARFGSNYLAKFGWDASKGLGAAGEGRLSHIKVTQKLDMMGIGAAHQMDPNGIAWKQNRDFENLLKRLNENSDEQTTTTTTAIGGFHKAVAEEGEGEAVEDAGALGEGEKEKKKRRDKEGDEQGELGHRKKRRKGEEENTVAKSTSMDVDKAVETQVVAVVEVKRPAIPRHRAHRARAIAAKNISSKSAAHISEILGVAPTPTPSTSTPTPSSEHEQGKLTSLSDANSQLELEKITTSTKSLADYFKEKLATKSLSGFATPTSTASTPAEAVSDDAYDMPRMGLGSSRGRLEVEVRVEECVRADEATQRMGLSKFSALVSSSFLAATSLPTSSSADVEDGTPSEPAEEVKGKEEKEKKGKKEKKKVKESAEADEADVEEKRRKKKDRKGKEKEVADEVRDVDGKEKKKKKEKKRKSSEARNEDGGEGLELTEAEDVESSERKGKKEKTHVHKRGSEARPPDEEKRKKSKKSKKTDRTSGDDS